MILFKQLIKIILLLAFAPVSAQSFDLTGNWTGPLWQSDKNRPFQMSLTLEQTGDQLSGKAKYLAYDGSGYYIIYDITGSIKDNKITMLDMSVAEEVSVNWLWCKKVYTGTITVKKDSLILSGDWENEGEATTLFINGKLTKNTPYYCYPGTFRISRRFEKKVTAVPLKIIPPDTSLRQRKISIVKTIDVVSDTVTLYFYDNAEIDNDSISVYIDKVLVLKNKKLTGKPLAVPVSFTSGVSHQIVMYAENQGAIPPNTAILIFTDNDQRREIRMSSDTLKSAAIILRKKNN